MIFNKFIKLLERASNRLFGQYIERQYDAEAMRSVLGEEQEQEHRKKIQKKKNAPAPAAPADSIDALSLKKREIFTQCLKSGVTSVMLDATVAGVVVPESFMGARDLTLNYSYLYNIRDFSFDENAIVASLSFSGVPFKCTVPWSAVLSISSEPIGKYYAFDQRAVPVQTSSTVQRQHAPKKSQETPEARRKKFQVIKGGKA